MATKHEKPSWARIEQKVDDMAVAIKDHILREEPIIALVQQHEEALGWLKKSLWGLLGMCATIASAVIIGFIHHR